MNTNIEYQFHSLTGRTDNSGPDLPAERKAGKNGRAEFRTHNATGGVAGYLGSIGRMVKSSGGPALLVSLGVIGIPFLIYFLALGAAAVLRTFG